MFTFWRYLIAFLAVSTSSIIFFFLVKTSVYDVQFSESLPPKGIQDIPPTDTIIPNIFAQILPSPLPTSTSTSSLPISSLPTPTNQPEQPESEQSEEPEEPEQPKQPKQPKQSNQPKKPKQTKQPKQPKQTSSSQSSLNFQVAVSPQQCFDYAKNCRDVQCAFQRFNVICDNNGNGPTCTCGMGQTSSTSSIQINAHFVFLITFIFTISFYQFC